MIDFVILLLTLEVSVNLALNACKLWKEIKERKK